MACRDEGQVGRDEAVERLVGIGSSFSPSVFISSPNSALPGHMSINGGFIILGSPKEENH